MMVKLGDICCINPSMSLRPDDYEVSFVSMPMVSETGNIDTSTVRQFGEVKKGFTYFEEDDVLFAKITPCMENGKGAIARGLMNGIGFGSTEFHVLRPNKEHISSEWLYYLTSWDVFRRQCEKNMTGSAGQKRVPKGFLEKYAVNIPSLEEQAHQAAVLDKVSGLIALRKKQLQKLDELVKARFVEMFGDLKSNDKSWRESRIDEVCEMIVDCVNKTAPTVEDKTQYKMLRTTNVKKGRIDTDNVRFVEKDTFEKWTRRAIPRKGDIVLTREAPMGEVGIIDTDENLFLGQRLVLYRVNSGRMNALYLMYLMMSDYFQDQIMCKGKGSTVKHLPVPDCTEFSVLVPEIELQEQFGMFVKQTDKSKWAIQKGLERLELMKKALMQKYFG